VLAGTNATASTAAPSGGSATPAPDTAPPTIAINGTNPAIIHIGDSYADLGATITGPQADLNLGIRIFLNGALVSNIVIDTTQVATDTIDYVAIDQMGLTATSTRTVIVRAPDSAQSPTEVINPNVATTSPAAATTTAQ
jgi:surface protein with Ig-like domain